MRAPSSALPLIRVGKPAGAVLGEPAARLLRRCDESTYVGIAIDGKSFCQKVRTGVVHMEFCESGVRGVDLARQT